MQLLKERAVYPTLFPLFPWLHGGLIAGTAFLSYEVKGT